ncbi:anti-sigma factor family protein [Lutispora thermophila]|uniref:Zinc-finger n=1 Tax=Lutispora thermophila DSM 19022 TaxID=1122184 RepID=A0A1M6CJ48_9FIRM|nr:hypothetical protein [Lutispora thermophila]SHI60774.1 hypothetical protein SAMN02745176_00794 [Lutispora thermophila DSM 19022]
MECKFDKSLLQALIDNTIEPLELIFLAEHLKVCQQCRNELEELYSVDQAIKSLFNDDFEYGDKLSVITELTVHNIYAQSEEKMKLKDIISDTVRMNNIIIENSTRFLKYVPGILFIRRKAREKYRYVRKSISLIGKNAK